MGVRDPTHHGETEIHQRAKETLVEVVQTTPEKIHLYRTCPNCRDVVRQALPPGITGAQVEYRLPSGLRSDMVLLGEAGVVACVEIRMTSRVHPQKVRRLNLPWIELGAEAVLRNALDWHVLQEGHLKPPACAGRLAKQQGRLMPIVVHRQAVHAVVCPEQVAHWDAYSYANVIDACSGCPYYVGLSSEGEEGAKVVLADDPRRVAHPAFFSCASPHWDQLSPQDRQRYRYLVAHRELWGRAEPYGAHWGYRHTPEVDAGIQAVRCEQDEVRRQAQDAADARSACREGAKVTQEARDKVRDEDAATWEAFRRWTAEQDITHKPLDEIRRDQDAIRREHPRVAPDPPRRPSGRTQTGHSPPDMYRRWKR